MGCEEGAEAAAEKHVPGLHSETPPDAYSETLSRRTNKQGKAVPRLPVFSLAS